MVIMALDHTRDFMHLNGMFYDPTDLTTTTPALFLTRLLTHICAPTFVFLSGVSAYLSGQKKSRGQLIWFLFSRGLWMILLELSVLNFAFWFDPTLSQIQLQVMWAIGVSMIVLSGLVLLPWRLTLLIGLTIVVGHNALDTMHVPLDSSWYILWTILHEPAQIRLSPDLTLSVLYPVLPWIGIMVLGYSAGRLFHRNVAPDRRKGALLTIGLAALISFVFLRLNNTYGDPIAWSFQPTVLFTLLSFLNVTKYPPSLLYALLTLGTALLLLCRLEIKPNRWINVLTTYGQVPLFYYIVHFYVLHLLAVLQLLAVGYSWTAINFQNGTGGIPKGEGVSLGATYLIWLALVVSLYPACRWYSHFKSRQTREIWSYL
jgi:uncharacterized membrane protein